MTKHVKLIAFAIVASAIEIFVWEMVSSYFWHPIPVPGGISVPALIIGSNVTIALVLGAKRKSRWFLAGLLITVGLVAVSFPVQDFMDDRERQRTQDQKTEAPSELWLTSSDRGDGGPKENERTSK